MALFLLLIFLINSSCKVESGTQWFPNRVLDPLTKLKIFQKPQLAEMDENFSGRSEIVTESSPEITEQTESTESIFNLEVGSSNDDENNTTTDFEAENEGVVTLAQKHADVRLPDTMKPLHYTVMLQPFVNGNQSIHGFMEVDILVLKNTSEISIHIDEIECAYHTVKLIPVDDVEASPIKIIRFTVDLNRQFLTALLDIPLKANRTYRYSMFYFANLTQEPKGFFSFTYSNSDGAPRTFAATAFQPTYARRAFPCFDEPSLKATFNISLARELNMSSISNMPLSKTAPIDGNDGWVLDTFEITPPMSTYLVAFVISDLKNINSTVRDDLILRVWAQEDFLQEAEFALDLVSSVCSFFEDQFGIPYPLPKLDVVALPSTFAMAFEGWGLILGYEGKSFLYNPKTSLPTVTHAIGMILAHEVAHQWFGNLVTPLWWTDIWLNEGFASYMENLALAKVKPEWNVEAHQVMKDLHEVLRKDSLLSSHPISIPVYHPVEISKIFDRISYDKGSSIIRMMSHFLSEESFKKGVTNFLSTHMFSGANQDNLWEALTKVGHEDHTLPDHLSVKEIMDTWTLQMGYPVINVIRSEDGTFAAISQERFLLMNNTADDDHDLMWWVPLAFTTQINASFTNTKPSIWLRNASSPAVIMDLPNKDKWVIFNLQQTGFYRINYDDNNWDLITKQLLEDHQVINVINRAQIIDDALNLALAGRMSYAKALDVTQYLKKETELAVWDATFGNIEHMNSMLANTAAYGGFQKYVLSLLLPLYEQLGIHGHPAEPYINQMIKPDLLRRSCEFGHQPCIQYSRDLYKQWMDNPQEKNIVPDDLEHVYCTAIAYGGLAEWEFAWQQYLDTNADDNLKDKLIKALTCSKENWIKTRYLNMAFTQGVPLRAYDTYQIYDSIASDIYDRNTAWDFLRSDLSIVYSLFGYNYDVIKSFLERATRSFNTKTELQELETFLTDHQHDQFARSAAKEAIDRTRENIAWMNRNYDIINQWLENQGFATSLRF